MTKDSFIIIINKSLYKEPKMGKTIAEINQKIRQGQAVVATAEEIIGIAREKGIE